MELTDEEVALTYLMVSGITVGGDYPQRIINLFETELARRSKDYYEKLNARLSAESKFIKDGAIFDGPPCDIDNFVYSPLNPRVTENWINDDNKD